MAKPESTISPARLEIFSDGIIAIIITVMVIEIHPPKGFELSAWQPILPSILAYLFSFIFLAIYWNNHHHLFRVTKNVTPGVMWANMMLLFFLSLIPVTTAWLGASQDYKHPWPVAVYATISLLAGLSFFVLTRAILKADPSNMGVAKLSRSKKGMISPILYMLAIGLAFVNTDIAILIMVATALLWFIPDKRLTT